MTNELFSTKPIPFKDFVSFFEKYAREIRIVAELYCLPEFYISLKSLYNRIIGSETLERFKIAVKATFVLCNNSPNPDEFRQSIVDGEPNRRYYLKKQIKKALDNWDSCPTVENMSAFFSWLRKKAEKGG